MPRLAVHHGAACLAAQADVQDLPTPDGHYGLAPISIDAHLKSCYDAADLHSRMAEVRRAWFW